MTFQRSLAKHLTVLPTNGGIYQCVPNFSEGRRPETVADFVAAANAFPRVRVIDWSMDPDHNRSVITLLGEAQPIHDAVLAMAHAALAAIDLRTHTGIHPRTGAVDVVPVVPVRGASRSNADLLAHTIGRSMAQRLDIPVYFYEWSSPPCRSRALPEVRRLLKSASRGAAVQLAGNLAPDLGPSTPHLTAGITVVGARGPLAAYNIDLISGGISIAEAIAHAIRSGRESIPHLKGVRALGLYLSTRSRAQVSMNLISPEDTPLPAIWDFVRAQAKSHGTDPAESEVIGVISSSWLGSASPADINWMDFSDKRLLETWLND